MTILEKIVKVVKLEEAAEFLTPTLQLKNLVSKH